LANGAEALRQLMQEATAAALPEDRRPRVVLSVEEHRAVAQAVRALADGDAGLYQRGGQLVRVVRASKAPQARRLRPSASLRVEPLPSPDLRVRLTRVARCVVLQKRKQEESPTESRARPPRWLV